MKLDKPPTVMRYREKVERGSLSVVQEKLDSTWLKTVALEAGADDAGLVEIDRPEIIGKISWRYFPGPAAL